jgi:hypothetical protein
MKEEGILEQMVAVTRKKGGDDAAESSALLY